MKEQECIRKMAINRKRISLPLTTESIVSLHAGDSVLLTGFVFTARDMAHKRIVENLRIGTDSGFDLQNATIYYCGPCPAPPDSVIGSAGPTTSMRMDPYTPALLQAGVKGMIGKGDRSRKVIGSIAKNKAVYFGATGGAGALISQCIKQSEVVAFDDLGTEAVRKIYIEDLPAIVLIDSEGNNQYQIGRTQFIREHPRKNGSKSDKL
jgi:fumarate hydratase subunit beta